jgi:hypothetical protein
MKGLWVVLFLVVLGLLTPACDAKRRKSHIELTKRATENPMKTSGSPTKHKNLAEEIQTILETKKNALTHPKELSVKSQNWSGNEKEEKIQNGGIKVTNKAVVAPGAARPPSTNYATAASNAFYKTL